MTRQLTASLVKSGPLLPEHSSTNMPVWRARERAATEIVTHGRRTRGSRSAMPITRGDGRVYFCG